ncbi:hypothetical protein H072_6998 [Dactylellina haptotyla CBS 200.50]|uniref:DUF4211 domain-containing protein n=1 Tax=Dactylellina haptotyla (strain CBS 200.50) TaxID=1284197 RepID=S8ADP4_DACHA|nr:hypothetical protein H072_6998 [Dactylellina haptotyla CBS 200.50]
MGGKENHRGRADDYHDESKRGRSRTKEWDPAYTHRESENLSPSRQPDAEVQNSSRFNTDRPTLGSRDVAHHSHRNNSGYRRDRSDTRHDSTNRRFSQSTGSQKLSHGPDRFNRSLSNKFRPRARSSEDGSTRPRDLTRRLSQHHQPLQRQGSRRVNTPTSGHTQRQQSSTSRSQFVNDDRSRHDQNRNNDRYAQRYDARPDRDSDRPGHIGSSYSHPEESKKKSRVVSMSGIPTSTAIDSIPTPTPLRRTSETFDTSSATHSDAPYSPDSCLSPQFESPLRSLSKFQYKRPPSTTGSVIGAPPRKRKESVYIAETIDVHSTSRILDFSEAIHSPREPPPQINASENNSEISPATNIHEPKTSQENEPTATQVNEPIGVVDTPRPRFARGQIFRNDPYSAASIVPPSTGAKQGKTPQRSSCLRTTENVSANDAQDKGEDTGVSASPELQNFSDTPDDRYQTPLTASVMSKTNSVEPMFSRGPQEVKTEGLEVNTVTLRKRNILKGPKPDPVPLKDPELDPRRSINDAYKVFLFEMIRIILFPKNPHVIAGDTMRNEERNIMERLVRMSDIPTGRNIIIRLVMQGIHALYGDNFRAVTDEWRSEFKEEMRRTHIVIKPPYRRDKDKNGAKKVLVALNENRTPVRCSCCKRRHLVSSAVEFSGIPYSSTKDYALYNMLKERDQDAETDHRSDQPGDVTKRFNLGQNCDKIVALHHKLRHWERLLTRWVREQLEKRKLIENGVSIYQARHELKGVHENTTSICEGFFLDNEAELNSRLKDLQSSVMAARRIRANRRGWSFQFKKKRRGGKERKERKEKTKEEEEEQNILRSILPPWVGMIEVKPAPDQPVGNPEPERPWEDPEEGTANTDHASDSDDYVFLDFDDRLRIGETNEMERPKKSEKKRRDPRQR